MFNRQNVYELGDDWADTILWYARGIKAMKSRDLKDVTGWLFYGAIHGYMRPLWDLHGVTDPADPSPSDADRQSYVDQCQHQSWYFLPWHRGYLLALERQIRTEIKSLGGPYETWALPYWNYFGDEQSNIPPAFRTPDWPDGTGDNPLFVPQRWGPISGDAPFDITQLVNLGPMSDREFSGPGNGGSTGFGGPPTSFNRSGGENGGVESQPHNIIHGLVGGQHPTQTIPTPGGDIPLPGLMAASQTSALDPIFYLHHCNIDRLWESWNKFPPGKPTVGPNDWRNPSDSNWREGPPASGDREFAMPNPDKTKWVFTPAEMEDIAALDYAYDDLTPGAPVESDVLAARVSRLGITPTTTEAAGVAMSADKTVELIGSGAGKVSLAGADTRRSAVRLDTASTERFSLSLEGAGATPGLPDRAFLNLENVRSNSDAVLFKVYVGLPPNADPEDNPEYLAGTISLFGSSLASDPEGKHAGNGITHVIEITDIFDRLYLGENLAAPEVNVDLVPVDDIPDAAKVEIGNISIYRQSE